MSRIRNTVPFLTILKGGESGDLVCEGTLEVFLLGVEQQAAIAAVEESAHSSGTQVNKSK
jgi:hypothetical protein